MDEGRVEEFAGSGQVRNVGVVGFGGDFQVVRRGGDCEVAGDVQPDLDGEVGSGRERRHGCLREVGGKERV